LYWNVKVQLLFLISAYLFYVYSFSDNLLNHSWYYPRLFLSIFILAFFFVSAGSMVFHYTSHNYNRSRFNINNLMLWFVAVMSSYPPSYWLSDHCYKHHIFTNTIPKDNDLNNSSSFIKVGNIVFRNTSVFKFFVLYMLSASFFHFYNFWFHIRKEVSLKEYLVIKILNMILFCLIPFVVSGFDCYSLIFCFLPFPLLWIMLLLLSQMAHIGPHQKIFNTDKTQANDFFVRQLETTANFSANNKFMIWFTGGLTHQIEHHLFPRAHPYYLPKIAKIVKQYCLENNLPYYEYPTFVTALKQHLGFVVQLAEQEKQQGI